MVVVRVYASDDSFLSLEEVSIPGGQIQVVLAFARDYDAHGSRTNGNIITYFNKQQINPTLIKELKDKAATPMKFLLSIGSRKSQFPFYVTRDAVEIWKRNAIDSLTRLIQQYHFDGIDVYYENINASTAFTDAIGPVIEELRNNGVITMASITPSFSVNSQYIELYKKHSNYINNVVYQSHLERNVIPTVAAFEALFQTLIQSYPKAKLLAGHNILPADWTTVSRVIFLLALPFQSFSNGISNWTVITDDPDA